MIVPASKGPLLGAAAATLALVLALTSVTVSRAAENPAVADAEAALAQAQRETELTLKPTAGIALEKAERAWATFLAGHRDLVENLVGDGVLSEGAAAALTAEAIRTEADLLAGKPAAGAANADRRLNATFGRCVVEFPRAQGVELRELQRTWIAYRDASAEFHRKTGRPAAQAAETLTAARALSLERLLAEVRAIRSARDGTPVVGNPPLSAPSSGPSASAPGPAGSAAPPAPDRMSPNEEAQASFHEADRELNQVYNAILAELAAERRDQSSEVERREHAALIEAFRKAQRAWVEFRTAEGELVAQTYRANGGHGGATYGWERETELTRARIQELQNQRQ